MNEKITALVVTSDSEKTERLRAAFSSLAGFVVRVEAATFQDCVAKLRETAADVAVVFLDEQRGGGGTLVLEQLKRTRDNVFAFAVSSERSAEVIVKAIRAGADELLSTMPSSEELLKAVVKIAERRRTVGTVSDSRVISVYSPHGGVGVTTFAVNLATSLRKITGQDVVLVDLDLQSGETPVFLDYKPLYTIVDVCQSINNLDHAFMQGALFAHSSGIHVLSPPFNLEDSEAVTAADVEKIVTTLRTMFPYIVIDTASYLSETTFVALEKADSVYMLTDNMVTSVRAVQRATDTLARLGLDTALLRMVLSKPGAKSEISLKDVGDALKAQVAYTLPLDEATAVSAINHGTLLEKVNSRSPLLEAIMNVAKAEAGGTENRRREGGSRGLFGRFFSEARP